MSRRLTPGQEALREAARLEAARVYGGIVREHRSSSSLMTEVAENLLAHADHQAGAGRAEMHSEADPVENAVREGWATSRIIDTYGVTYAEVRAVRKQVMAEGAA